MNTIIGAEQFVSLRLGASDAQLMRVLHERTGLSKTDIVKRALRLMASQSQDVEQVGLYELGRSFFGRYGDATRQSADIKSIVRQRMIDKRIASALVQESPPK